MEHRFSRASSSRSATASDIDDALYPAYHHYRPGSSLAVSVSRRPVPSPSRDNVQPRPPSPENVFADPADSPPPSPTGSAFYSNSIVTPTPSVRRPSLSLSARRSPSPLPGANVGYYSQHRLSQSLTPSVRSSTSSNFGNGLNRSNTTGTGGTGHSTLSSIPSNLSDLTSPPSPLPPIAPVRPQWNYGGHQQNIYPESVNESIVPEENDPFADDFMIPVGDGFAPHHQRPPPIMMLSSASSVGSLEPPPYTRYPDQPNVEEAGVLLMQPPNGDSGIDVSRGPMEGRGGIPVLAAAGGANLLDGSGMLGAHLGDDDGSGAKKEWEEKRVLGFRMRAIVLGAVIALVVLLAVGLGVGLGIGLKVSSESGLSTVYPNPPLASEVPPNPEQTGPPLSSPNETFPPIPTGFALLDPLILSDYSSACSIIPDDASSPRFFSQGSDLLWSCQFDHSQIIDALTWRFERFPPGEVVNMESFVSRPDFLRGAEYGEGAWGGYLISSLEGVQLWENELQLVIIGDDGTVVEYSGKGPWRDGTQNQPFWKIPVAYYEGSDFNSNKVSRRELNQTSNSYRFGALIDKTVIIRKSTIEANIASITGDIRSGNGTILTPGEIVWKCIWEKTLFEVEVLASVHSEAFSQLPAVGNGEKGQSGYHESSRSSKLYPTQPTGIHNSPTGTLLPPSGNLSLGFKHRLRSFRHKRTFTDARPFGKYPLKVSIKESRPTSNRIRQLLGMDLTDPDPFGRSVLGEVKCTQFIVTADGGLTPFIDRMSGEGFVTLREEGGTSPGLKEKRGSEDSNAQEVEQMLKRNLDCYCQWSS